jgi:hypothetical protein
MRGDPSEKEQTFYNYWKNAQILAPEPTGFGVSLTNAGDVCSSSWEAVP